MTSTDLCNQCFKTCSWIPQTINEFVLSKSALLEINIPALAFNCFNCSYAISLKKISESAYNLQNPLTVAEAKTLRLVWNPRHNK